MSFSVFEAVVVDEVDSVDVEEDKAFEEAAAIAAKGEEVAFAKLPNEGTVVVCVVDEASLVVSSAVVVVAVLNAPNPEVLLNPPNVGLKKEKEG